MNTTATASPGTVSSTRQRIVINAVGALIVTAALAVGAGVGNFASTDTPANAGTPDAPACTLVCGESSGGGGNTPNMLTSNVSGSGGNVGGNGGRR